MALFGFRDLLRRLRRLRWLHHAVPPPPRSAFLGLGTVAIPAGREDTLRTTVVRGGIIRKLVATSDDYPSIAIEQIVVANEVLTNGTMPLPAGSVETMSSAKAPGMAPGATLDIDPWAQIDRRVRPGDKIEIRLVNVDSSMHIVTCGFTMDLDA